MLILMKVSSRKLLLKSEEKDFAPVQNMLVSPD